jgi:cytochrome c-type biogenesis protein CcmE
MTWLLALLVAAGCKKVIAADEFLEVDELVARDPATLTDTPLRVHGYVKRGTISSKVIDQKSQLTFQAINKDKVVRVVYAGPMPDKFQDQAEVIVRGKLAMSGELTIEATDVLAKCPTNYDRNKGPQPTQYQ